jgi:hypothetical protein
VSRILRAVGALGSSALLAGVVASAPANAATPTTAKPTVTVTTGKATSISGTEEMLTGTIDNKGKAVQWQFQYGRSTTYGSGTPAKGLVAKTGAQTVSVLIKHLKANTTYHYRLVAITGSTSGTSKVLGMDATFRTGGTGLLLLNAKTLTAAGNRVIVPLTCDSTLACKGKFSIGTRARAAKTKKLVTIVCVSGASLSIKAHQTEKISAKLRPGCVALLKSKKKIAAKVTSYPRTGQKALIKSVTVLYKP